LVIPLRDVIPSRTTPFVTLAIVALNALALIYHLLLGDAGPALLYLGANMLFLWLFGDNVEDRMGHGRFVAFCLLCASAAALTQTVVDPGSSITGVAATGTISGIMGAYLVLYPRSLVVTLLPMLVVTEIVEVPALVFLCLWLLLQLVSGHVFWADLAALAAGAGVVMLFRRPERQRVEWWHDAPR
jgi:membrane associated rhomboid family serine protease